MEYKEEFAEIKEMENVEPDFAEQANEETQTSSENEISEELAVVAKKKFPIQGTIIIAACILLVAVLGFFALKIFVPTIEGSWTYTADGELDLYYTFDQKPDGNECELTLGTIHFPGDFVTGENETGKTVTVNIYAGYIYGDYTYEVTGNRLLKNRVLTLTNADGTTFTLNETKQPKDSDYILPDENFEEVEELTGEWKFVYPEVNLTYTLTLNDDGTMIYSQDGMQELHCVYTANDSTVNISFYETELIVQEEEYYFEGDQLIFLGINWTRAEDATVDEI